ncbi:hypothetical protein BC829DRAFT_382603 [Chytridium lagenaria]|nr:hypothetical protein BC829DRAFT_382603 [Chytridium lagenaria]
MSIGTEYFGYGPLFSDMVIAISFFIRINIELLWFEVTADLVKALLIARPYPSIFLGSLMTKLLLRRQALPKNLSPSANDQLKHLLKKGRFSYKRFDVALSLWLGQIRIQFANAM